MSSCCAIACGGLRVGCNQFGRIGGCPERVPPVCVACAGNSKWRKGRRSLTFMRWRVGDGQQPSRGSSCSTREAQCMVQGWIPLGSRVCEFQCG